MSEKEAMKCPKCGGEMKYGEIASYGGIRIRKQGDLSGDRINAFYCQNCGFIEFYKEPSTKEPWRWQKEQVPSTENPQQQEKEQSSTETSKKRLVR
jgi:predicted nucleic-acid-binding Zn-ribbon protein